MGYRLPAQNLQLKIWSELSFQNIKKTNLNSSLFCEENLPIWNVCESNLNLGVRLNDHYRAPCKCRDLAFLMHGQAIRIFPAFPNFIEPFSTAFNKGINCYFPLNWKSSLTIKYRRLEIICKKKMNLNSL